MTEPITIIIAAGGTGTRFGTEVPKQFVSYSKRPVLWHTIKAFSDFLPHAKMVIAMHAESISLWEKMCNDFDDVPAHTIVKGGETRFQSVKNALEECPQNGIILVHDAVRPFISQNLVDRIVKTALKEEAVIPVIEVTDSIRQLMKGSSVSVNRKDFVRVQTPQAFKAEVLLKAYNQKEKSYFTDDASVVEGLGYKISLVPGDPNNIKITLIDDLPKDM